ncbi:related to S.pombe rad8 protein and Rdh54p [Rhynchosporium secalis]|uniref:Related to S.pombe rad8 protein and Rdh54p n=1 Tax=Rhynchosporium secalis TaxID=38038 RepID=A0A1E1MEI3_RHYSE|nr:related to S.pombe rad8 protein and Rdh54p [Rhynchosporium secalis]
MGRAKRTARRALSRNGVSKRRGPSVGYANSSSNSIPHTGQGSSSDSETASPTGSLPARDLTDALIDFMLGSPSTLEPPQKRQKIMSGIVEESDYGHIVVKKSTWDINFASRKLSLLDTPLVKNNIRPFVHWIRNLRPEYIEIMDESKQCVFHAPLPPKDDFEDLYLALSVSRSLTSKAQGRLWTEFGLALVEKERHDVLQITFEIKWNITLSPHHILQSTTKPKAISQVLARYYPDPNASKAEKWSPQDFYTSVHSPVKNNDVAEIKVGGLETDLYPFQQRAVKWLLKREGAEWSAEGVRKMTPSLDSELPLSFLQAIDDNGRMCYVSHLFGVVTMDITPFMESQNLLKGGILAEEMGLGKTVEMISLISLHKCPREEDQVFDIFTEEDVRPTGATLIIAPPSILQQWISEINRHAPGLKVMHYEGIKAYSKRDFSDLVDDLAGSDVVVSSYAVLNSEIHFTRLNPEKSLRREPKYPRPKSPLMMLSWWRCVIDEAQMIESGVSNAAVVARMIPRINAWCVTGTPVRKDVNDLLGLIVFLRHEPFASIKYIWSSLISTHKNEFRKLFGSLALRHSKQSVRDELKLPAQRRYVITMPFTPVEEQHYQEMFNEMCAECGVDAQGAPMEDNWNPDDVTDVMRRWLVRLRQTALHPEIGGKNRRALGQKEGPLRTVDQVLSAMMENTDVAIRTDQRALLTTKLKRGQLFENSPRVKEALEIWSEAADAAKVIVDECRVQLQQEIAASTVKATDEKAVATKSASEIDNESDDEPEEIDPSSRVGVCRNRLRTALEIEHMAIFFRTNAYFQVKTNEEMTKPNSEGFRALEKLEEEGYEAAKKLRQEILQEVSKKADRLMKKVSRKAATQSFVQIPEMPSEPAKGGIESRRILEKLDALSAALDAQANVLDEWRETTIQFLLRPLVDDDSIETTGDEYEESTKTQDEVMVYVNVLRAVIIDRYDALTGQTNELVKQEVKTTLRVAMDGEGACPEKTVELLAIRGHMKPSADMGSIRGTVSELRALSTSLRTDVENGRARAQNELVIVDKQLKEAQRLFTQQTKAISLLEKEIELFTKVMNIRLEYYRQLQQVSDMVAPYEGPIDMMTVSKFLQEEESLAKKIAIAKSKRRYLDHLRMEATNPQEQRMCVICQESFETGALTVCGHQFCKECIRQWFHTNHNCPVCKRKLLQTDMHQITYKPQELSIETEEVHDANQERFSPTQSSKYVIYSQISKSKLAEIKNTELDGPSFTTKVDTLARHLIWLRESDPGAKSIIFSQFKDFLDVLAQAFAKFRIGFTSIDKPNGIETFKQDPGIECFLLHARAHSSGLNLVNASHVFLCEPLLNTALELQAIARVDRIGQQQETNVWLYLVDGTVEESIHQLSVKRRMEHIGKRLAGSGNKSKGKARDPSPVEILDSNIEEANSMELQQASLTGLLAKGGKGEEMVNKEDLWDCLFGTVTKRASKDSEVRRKFQESNLRLDTVVGRELRAGAADERMGIAGPSESA